VTFHEDTATSRTGSRPADLATITAGRQRGRLPARPRRPTRPHHPAEPLRLHRPRLGQTRTFAEHAGARQYPGTAGHEDRLEYYPLKAAPERAYRGTISSPTEALPQISAGHCHASSAGVKTS
jgi:hypothetical protein